MMDNSLLIECWRCQTNFRERASRLTSGYSRQCPNCEAIIIFDDESQTKEIRAAMALARQIRRTMKEEAEDAPIVKKRSVLMSERGAPLTSLHRSGSDAEAD
jgi:hypothetical protein